jgi:hypothetical protein
MIDIGHMKVRLTGWVIAVKPLIRNTRSPDQIHDIN